jgi:hypothetical protein
MSTAQLAAVSFLARYCGHTHDLYAYQLREWFSWCETHGLDPLVCVQRAHLELDSSVVTVMHAIRGFFRFAHIDGLISSDPVSTPDCRRCIATSPAPRAWTGWS